MKIPRDLSGKELIRYLKIYGYSPTRQTGSHIRVTTQMNGEHHITIPNNDPLKIGTLTSILDSVATHLQITKQDLYSSLFS